MTTPVGDVLPERVLGEIAGAVVVAVRGGRPDRTVRVGDREVRVADDEQIVVRHG